jgi:hypothetical protein
MSIQQIFHFHCLDFWAHYKASEKKYNKENIKKEEKEFFSNGDILQEAIFYSGTGVYDFQYLDFLEKKYKYDKKWLLEKKNFDIKQAKLIVNQIKNILQNKAKTVHLYDFIPKLIEDTKKKYPNEDWENRKKDLKDFVLRIKLNQYIKLFELPTPKKILNIENVRNNGWQSFYKNLPELFIIRKSDFDKDLDIDSFLNNFSISFKKNLNSQFQTIGNFNLIDASPIIKLDKERYFVSNTFLLFQAVYESPFYWMLKDKSYRDQLTKNRGKAGEEIAYNFLSKVFGKNNTFKSVKIKIKKNEDATDIDVLAILGSKALCVQVKSKKLTEFSKKGDIRHLKEDFKKAVQEAYSQGLISRKEILEKRAKFIDEKENEIKLSEDINEAYIMCITAENYPSLTHQAHELLDKKNEEPFPIVLTVFDLELLSHYLNDPYDFLYYIRQRISLMNSFRGDNEMAFLGYHLLHKLWKISDDYQGNHIVALDKDWEQFIDRNYYPIKAGLKVSDKGDEIKSRWRDENFNKLCNLLKTINEPKITDIIFHLLDLSGDMRKKFIDLILKTKQRTLNGGKSHSFSKSPVDSYSSNFGITYTSLCSDNLKELKKELSILCLLRKYKNKGNVWIGFGSLKSSQNIIDTVYFNNEEWEYDKNLEMMPKLKGKILKAAY